MATHFTTHLDASELVEFHCDHEDTGHSSFRCAGPINPVYVTGSITEVVEFGERLIQAAIGHAAPDRSEAVLWRDYLAVCLERAEKAVRDERSIDVELWSA